MLLSGFDHSRWFFEDVAPHEETLRLSYTGTLRRLPYDSAAPRMPWTMATSGTVSVSRFNPDL